DLQDERIGRMIAAPSCSSCNLVNPDSDKSGNRAGIIPRGCRFFHAVRYATSLFISLHTYGMQSRGWLSFLPSVNPYGIKYSAASGRGLSSQVPPA
ncbi:MAG: hypothetical protein LBN71_02990, partial [Tannerella sp.]|nr:hypothetical protein [Tannerella sp.]